jgi:hypothetical protein
MGTPQDIASNKLEEIPHRDYETACSSLLAIMVLKNIFKEFAVFTGFWPQYDLEMEVKVKFRT